MKIRRDFVTNSSSSSFIAIFGEATDINVAKESLKSAALEAYAVTGKELLEQWDDLKYENTCNDWCWVDPFPSKDSIKEDGLYFIYSDCEDVNADEDGYIDEEECNTHYEEVSDRIEKLSGFDFLIDQGSGRNG